MKWKSHETGDFAELYLRQWRYLVSRSRRIVGCQFLAEEIAQEAFLRWMVKHRAPERQEDPQLGLLYRILYGLSIDTTRARSVRNRLSHLVTPDAQSADGERILLARDTALHAEAALAALPARTRAAFLMRRDHEMSFAEIGAALGISASRAHQLASDALSALTACLNDDDEPAQK